MEKEIENELVDWPGKGTRIENETDDAKEERRNDVARDRVDGRRDDSDDDGGGGDGAHDHGLNRL